MVSRDYIPHLVSDIIAHRLVCAAFFNYGGGFIATTTIAAIIPILYIYTGENFPTRMRATSLSVTDGIGHIGGAFCGQIIFSIATIINHNSYTFSTALTIMAITGLLTAILLMFGLKMTGHSLTELAKPK